MSKNHRLSAGVCVSSDEIKRDLYGSGEYDVQCIYECRDAVLRTLVKKGVNLIVDSNSDQLRYREELQAIVKEKGYRLKTVYCKIALKNAFQRMRARKTKKFYSTQRKLREYLSRVEMPSKCL
jgi:predicted kinase